MKVFSGVALTIASLVGLTILGILDPWSAGAYLSMTTPITGAYVMGNLWGHTQTAYRQGHSRKALVMLASMACQLTYAGVTGVSTEVIGLSVAIHVAGFLAGRWGEKKIWGSP